MSSSDQLHRFIFDDTDIRGEIVTLDQSIKTQNAIHPLPEEIQNLLGEFLVAAALMSSTLKFDGIFTLQARGSGKLPLIFAEVRHNKHIRGIAQLSADYQPQTFTSLPALMGDEAILSITLDPVKGERYQGIVPLSESSLAECIEQYFEQSEQLPTKIWLHATEDIAAGLMLQRLPQQIASKERNAEVWNNRVQLANTVTGDELCGLEHEKLLTRLFHEEGVRIFDPSHLAFQCSCSKERCSKALTQLGREELDDILAERGNIQVDCQFCGYEYLYSRDDVEQLFSPPSTH